MFDTLGWLDALLGSKRFLCGERITEADWRLFTTLVRFDAVYVGHFKCNIRRLVDFPNLWAYARERHYYQSHGTINPTRIVPPGPHIDFELAPSRRLSRTSD